jgi:hypothetical protein
MEETSGVMPTVNYTAARRQFERWVKPTLADNGRLLTRPISIPALQAFVLFLTVFAIDAGMLWLTRDHHLGVHEDHFDKGVSLYENGSMSSGTKPMVFRAPGYPAFVAATLGVRDVLLTIASPVLGAPRVGRREAVLAAHAALLGLLGAAIFWFAVGRAGALVAGGCALGAGCNPALLILAGHVSYELLHLVLVASATLVFVQWTTNREIKAVGMFAQGLIWGVVSLVKSVTLIVPAFVLLWALLDYPIRKAVIATAFFSLGLCLVVTPYALRNYALTGRFIPVNEQAAFALWGTSLERIPPGAGYLDWRSMWLRRGMETYTEVTGTTTYTIAIFEDHVLELSDRFSAIAADNLRRDPMIYGYNAAHNAVMYVVDQPTSNYFDRYQWPHDADTSRLIAGASLIFMTVIGMAAMAVGALRRDRRWTLVLLLFVMMWAAHALTFLEARYLYMKIPTIVVGFVLACETMAGSRSIASQRASTIIAALAALLSVAGLLTL